jgi:hypothetical protein
MNRLTLLIITGVLVFISVVFFAFLYLKSQNDDVVTMPVNNSVSDVIIEDPYASITRITAQHFFVGGVHTLTGEIPMPTPCDTLDPKVVIAESSPEQVMVQFDILNESETCASVITPQRFKVEFTASENASIRASLNRRPVEFNLIPMTAADDPDEAEIFIKG